MPSKRNWPGGRVAGCDEQVPATTKFPAELLVDYVRVYAD